MLVVWQDYGGENDVIKEFQLNVVDSEWENFNGDSVSAHTQSSILLDDLSMRDK